MKTKRLKPSATRRGAGTDWNRLHRMGPAAIRKVIASDPDAHATDEAFWKSARVVMPVPKEIVTMCLDADLLRWFRRYPGYQTRISAILRAYMNAQD
ncbi:MAG: BrnA antitoxin family protein [Candidatus Sulfotelmatobacter sp.]